MKVETYFLRYAFPCSHILCMVRGEVDDSEYALLKRASLDETISIERDFLERVFFRAFERIDRIAQELGKDRWDKETIEEYFVVRHNDVVDKSDYPESFKNMCRVYEACVIEMHDNEAIVRYAHNKRRKVFTDYIRDVAVGDVVRIHWQYAVEKVI